jgi:hypothetical protein
MKLRNVPGTTKVALFAILLLATCLSASSANAQSALNGKFTLTEKAYWGAGVIPAGEYQLSITATGLPSTVVIRDATSGNTVAKLFPQVRESSTTGQSELLIGTRGKQRVVYALRLPQLGMVLISDPALVRGGKQGEAGKTQAIPVVVAAK